jgi:putative transcriptional regulator
MRRRLRLRPHLLGSLCTLLFLFHAAWTRSADVPAPLTAILISAKAELPDENFADSAVLVLNNLGPAPIGLITNRPTKFPISHLFPDLERRIAQVHDKVYFGGPIEVETVWFLVRASKAPEHAIKAFDDVYISASRELLLQLLGRKKPMEGLRIFIGHAGWAPGQLEAEIAQGDWALARANADTIFNGRSDHPWPSASASRPST